MHRSLRRCFGDPDYPQSGNRPRSLKEMGFGKKTIVGLVIVPSITVVLIIWGFDSKHAHKSNLKPINASTSASPIRPLATRAARTKRSSSAAPKSGLVCGAGLVLNYTKGATTSFTFDLCAAINCGGNNQSVSKPPHSLPR